MSSVEGTSLPRQLPSFAGATGWLGSEPLRSTDLRGRVVLVDFWTLTCINWLRTEPYVRAWSEAYRDEGLVVIGVHTPEFSFEHDIELVRGATRQRAIDYAVALDNGYEVWEAFDNHYWPALYLADREGVIRGEHFGEGAYEESERLIQRLLGIERPLVRVQPSGIEAQADWEHLQTPETYLGYARGERFASRDGASYDQSHRYVTPEHLDLNQWGLAGSWTIGAEHLSTDRPGAGIAFRFHARDAHLVLSSDQPGAIPFHVLLDGDAPGASHGEDVDVAGDGTLTDGRLYQLVREHETVRDRTLEITFAEPGAKAFVFTFG
jgi:thiol-disulfide isomerase/thioredoxin